MRGLFSAVTFHQLQTVWRIMWLTGLLVGTSYAADVEKDNTAPGFELPRLGGSGTVALADYRGSYVLVDFWTSWCAPCRQSLPAYNQLRNRIQRAHDGDAFEVLAINVDISAEEGINFLEQYPVDFPVLREETGRTQQAYNVMGVPTAFLVNPQGVIEFYYPGYSEHHLEVLEGHLIERLEGS